MRAPRVRFTVRGLMVAVAVVAVIAAAFVWLTNQEAILIVSVVLVTTGAALSVAITAAWVGYVLLIEPLAGRAERRRRSIEPGQHSPERFKSRHDGSDPDRL